MISMHKCLIFLLSILISFGNLSRTTTLAGPIEYAICQKIVAIGCGPIGYGTCCSIAASKCAVLRKSRFGKCYSGCQKTCASLGGASLVDCSANGQRFCAQLFTNTKKKLLQC